MLETDVGTESIGLEHLLFGESPYYRKTDTILKGKEILSREELKDYMAKIKELGWRNDESYNDGI